ncbi:MAG: IPT/TIG domain-containing protein [Prevotellaceae bacterium]|jgi:hypothetical protein|nr:IPT/TIG domain-containing protein [Prevotellaceae bacterium]
MKKIYTCIISLVLLAGSFALTGCGETQEELNTSQMGSGKVALKVYGPSPALRGGELRFIGDNMDKVTAINLPGAGDITDFVSKEKTELRITIPQNAEPGYPVVKSPEGEITTETPLSFEEPVSISSITTAKVKAGDTFTVEGDYLNLMSQVVFADNVVVDKLITHTRYKIEVQVPIAAKSGVIKLSNGADIPLEVYSGDWQANITAPVVTKVSEWVKPGAALTVTGTDLDLVESVLFSGGISVPIEEPGATSFAVTVPAETKIGADGQATATVIAYSGIETAMPFNLVAPTITALAPATDLRPGDIITITGTDLDLVTTLTFVGADGIAPASQSETELTVALPAPAQDGDLIFNTAGGLTLTQTISTKKPTITGYSPTPVPAGEAITLTGTDLDLVTQVTFAGEGATTVTIAAENIIDANTLTFIVPSVAETSAPQLTLINTTTVETNVTIEIKPATDPVIATMPEATTPGSIITITGKNLNYVESFYFGDNKVTYYEGRTAESVILQVPQATPYADYHVTMVTYAGQTFTSGSTIKVQSPEITVWEGPQDISGWGNAQRIYRTVAGGGLADFASLNLTESSTLIIYYTTTTPGGWFQIQMNDANWSSAVFGTITPGGDSTDGIPGPEGTNVRYEIALNADRLNTLLNVVDGWSDTALVLQGDLVILNKICILP